MPQVLPLRMRKVDAQPNTFEQFEIGQPRAILDSININQKQQSKRMLNAFYISYFRNVNEFFFMPYTFRVDSVAEQWLLVFGFISLLLFIYSVDKIRIVVELFHLSI